MKVLSIIIPTFNMEKYLERCLLSLVNDKKTLKNLDIIIVNDGSTDNSLNIAMKYVELYPDSISIINKENGGHGSTINSGLKVAKGKYIKVLDADDWVDIDCFPSFVSDLKSVDVDAVITNYVYENVYNNSFEIVKFDSIKSNKEYELSDYKSKKYFSIHSITYKTKILKDNNITLDINTFYVDMEYLIYPLKYINNFIYFDYDLYRYFIGRPDQSVNASSFVKHRADHERVIKNILSSYEENIKNTKNDNYALNIIKTLLRTHYIIYCKSRYNNKLLKREIRTFTKYLKKHYKNIYSDLLKNNTFIRWNVKTNFIFSQNFKCLLSRVADRFQQRRNA